MSQRGIPLRVLILDDQDSMRSIVRHLLGQVGITDILEAKDGSGAIKLLKTPNLKVPDVIISDLYMDGMDGLEFCNQLRRDKQLASNQIPILMLTGEKDPFIHDIIRQVGAADIAVKPISAVNLLQRIQDLIGYSFDD